MSEPGPSGSGWLGLAQWLGDQLAWMILCVIVGWVYRQVPIWRTGTRNAEAAALRPGAVLGLPMPAKVRRTGHRVQSAVEGRLRNPVPDYGAWQLMVEHARCQAEAQNPLRHLNEMDCWTRQRLFDDCRSRLGIPALGPDVIAPATPAWVSELQENARLSEALRSLITETNRFAGGDGPWRGRPRLVP